MSTGSSKSGSFRQNSGLRNRAKTPDGDAANSRDYGQNSTLHQLSFKESLQMGDMSHVKGRVIPDIILNPPLYVEWNATIVSIDDASETVTIKYNIQSTLRDTKNMDIDDNAKNGFKFLGENAKLNESNLAANNPCFIFSEKSCVMISQTVYPYYNSRQNFLYWFTTGTFQLHARSSLFNYPFDTLGLKFSLICLSHDMLPGMGAKNFIMYSLPSNWVLNQADAGRNELGFGVVASLTRKSRYYIWKYSIGVHFILACNVVVTGLDGDDLVNRNLVSLTIFLTLNAYRFTVQDVLPKGNYISGLDIHMMLAFITNFVFVIENLVVANNINRVEERDNFTEDDIKREIDQIEDADVIFQLTFVGLWTITMFAIVLVAYRYPRCLRKSPEKAQELNETKGIANYIKPLGVIQGKQKVDRNH